MNVHFVDIGFSNFIEVSKIYSINRPDSAPIKRRLQQAKEQGNFIDLTQGKKTRSIITQCGENGIVFTASAVQAPTIVERIKRAQQASKIIEDKHEDDVIKTTSI